MKKKKKKRPAMVYVVELKRWITVKECIDRTYHPEKYPDEMKRLKEAKKVQIKARQLEKFTKVQGIICDFIQEQDAKKGYRRIGGPIKGRKRLARILKENGFPRSATRIAEDNWSYETREDVRAAWRLYAKRVPPYPKEVLQAELPPVKPASDRKKLWGHNISSIIRFLGKEGFEFDEVKTILDHFGFNVERTTISGQLWCGTQRGKYGKIASLNDWQIVELMKPLKEENATQKTK